MFPLSSLGADAARVSHVTVIGLLGVVWAAGFAVVPLVLGAVASTTSTATAFTLASLLCLPGPGAAGGQRAPAGRRPRRRARRLTTIYPVATHTTKMVVSPSWPSMP